MLDSRLTEAQGEAITFLRMIYGKPTFVNAARPSIAVHVDFGPSCAYPFGCSWRIEPDGTIKDMTEALLESE